MCVCVFSNSLFLLSLSLCLAVKPTQKEVRSVSSLLESETPLTGHKRSLNLLLQPLPSFSDFWRKETFKEDQSLLQLTARSIDGLPKVLYTIVNNILTTHATLNKMQCGWNGILTAVLVLIVVVFNQTSKFIFWIIFY